MGNVETPHREPERRQGFTAYGLKGFTRFLFFLKKKRVGRKQTTQTRKQANSINLAKRPASSANGGREGHCPLPCLRAIENAQLHVRTHRDNNCTTNCLQGLFALK